MDYIKWNMPFRQDLRPANVVHRRVSVFAVVVADDIVFWRHYKRDSGRRTQSVTQRTIEREPVHGKRDSEQVGEDPFYGSQNSFDCRTVEDAQ